MQSGTLAVEMREVTKRFPGVLANDQVNLQVGTGEVHALLGENGAGKTTLMNILAGLYQPDSGEVFVNGRLLRFGSPRESIAAGIGVIHQHFHLVEVFSVAENVTLGLPEGRLALNLGSVQRKIEAIAGAYGWKIDPSARIADLCVGERQRIEILKALYRGARILILDEPTAVLTPQEAHQLAGTLRQMAAAGQAVIYISHKLKEVMEVADRVTILRAGRNVATVEVKNTSPRELARLMVGREVPAVQAQACAPAGPPVLEVADLQVAGDALGEASVPAVRGFSLEVQGGQIVGLAGVSGNGQRELAEAVAGLRRALGGRVAVCGHDVTNRPPLEIIQAGLSLVPEDRMGMGLIPTLNAYDNAILKAYREPPVAHGQLINGSEVRRLTERLVKEFSVQTARLDDPVWKLSGGNLQRLLLAREILIHPKVMVAAQPTRGLDVQATAEVHRLLLSLRAEGAGILLISEDLDEILQLADCIAVIHEGRLMGRFGRGEVTIEEIGLLMAGGRLGEAGAGEVTA
ncbi:MAG TPA: ABC transporter ATP-binding protein [Anaerolineae bacterium]